MRHHHSKFHCSIHYKENPAFSFLQQLFHFGIDIPAKFELPQRQQKFYTIYKEKLEISADIPSRLFIFRYG